MRYVAGERRRAPKGLPPLPPPPELLPSASRSLFALAFLALTASALLLLDGTGGMPAVAGRYTAAAVNTIPHSAASLVDSPALATPLPFSSPSNPSTSAPAATASSTPVPTAVSSPAPTTPASMPEPNQAALSASNAVTTAQEERYLLLTGYYGRFSNRMMQVAELLAMALLLNRSVILPSGKDPVRYGGMEAVLDLPSIDALGVRRVPAERAYETCSSLDGVFAVAGVMFNGEQPGWDALAPGIVSAPPDAGDSPPALPAVTSLNRLRAEPAAGWLPDDGGPATDAAGAARSEVWHTYPYPLLIDSTSAKRWTGAPADGIVVPGLPAALRALDPPPRCLALDSLYLTLDWRPHPALFRRVFSAVTAPTPALRAAVERLRGDGGLLGGQPYLALHLRMTDFCVRPGDWEAGGCQAGGFRRWLAPTLERMLAAAACSVGARQLLLLTDEPGHSWVEEVHAVAAAAGAVVRSVAVADSAGAAPDSEAALILLEQELAAGGECFMGGAASTFSALIRVRRDLAGRAWETMMPFQYE